MLLRQIYAAYRGSRLWAALERKYKVDEGVYVLLMPEDDAELNAAALEHVEDLVADRRARGVVLVTDGSAPRPLVSQPAASETTPQHSPGIVGTESWTGSQIDALIAFCELHNFSERLLIVSLTKPFGNGLHRLLGRQGVTKEDLVCLGCLRLRSYGLVRT
jgi:hypothetical protein